jgi:hypothetical protein
MKAVAIITPDPKYLAMKNVSFGTCIFLVLASHIGSRAPSQTLLGECVVMEKQMQIDNLPNIEPAPMTKMAEIRIPSRPSYPLGALQSIVMVLGDGNVSAMIVNYVKMTGPSQTRCLASSWKYMQPQDGQRSLYVGSANALVGKTESEQNRKQFLLVKTCKYYTFPFMYSR